MYLPEKDALRRLMQSRGIKATDLARQSGVSKGTISKILNKPQFEPSYRIMRLLFKTVDSISNGNVRPVRDLMTRRVITADEDEAVSRVKKKMLDNSVSQLPVLSDGKVIGLITESSILGNPRATVAKEALAFDYGVVSPDANALLLDKAVAQFQAILVMEGMKIVGILTKADFLR
jgi:predicted transcriptional regulator